MGDRRDVAALKDLAHRRAGEVLAALGVRDKPNAAGLILISNPRVKDLHPSFAIWVKGGFLAWKYFSSGEKGDVVDLVAYLKGWWERPDRGFQESVRWLEDLLGAKALSPARRAADYAASEAGRERDDKERAETLARGRRWARALFFRAAPFAGTIVETYLRARGIDFDRWPRGPRGGSLLPGAIRCLERHGHFDPHMRVETHWPCMVVPFTDAFGAVLAVHRTWLKPDGSGKAPVAAARKAYPATAGLILPLWRGLDRLSVNEAIKHGVRETLVLTEGVEDGLSAVLAAPAHRTWGAYSLGNIVAVAAALPENIDAVLIYRQNDWAKRGAVEAFERAKAAIEATGRPVAEIAAAAGGKDLNDMLRGTG